MPIRIISNQQQSFFSRMEKNDGLGKKPEKGKSIFNQDGTPARYIEHSRTKDGGYKQLVVEYENKKPVSRTENTYDKDHKLVSQEVVDLENSSNTEKANLKEGPVTDKTNELKTGAPDGSKIEKDVEKEVNAEDYKNIEE